jgi:hypothetical protein
MRLWLDGRPGLTEPPSALAEQAWVAMSQFAALTKDDLPLYTGPNVSVRIRFVYPLDEQGTSPPHRPPVGSPTTLAWYYCHVLEGLLWEQVGQIVSVHASKEWGKIAGVEVVV